MKLDNIDIPVTQKTDAQAVSLGFVTARRYYGQLFKVGILAVTPILIIAVILTLWLDYYFFSALLIWWLKPFYDSVILCQASHLVFREPVDTNSIVRGLKSVMNMGLVANLTWRRFSLIRGVSQSVVVQEGANSRTLAQHLNAMSKATRAKSSSITIGLLATEVLLYLNSFLLLIMLFPEVMRQDAIRWFLSSNLSKVSEGLEWLAITMLFFQALCSIIISVFYVMIGFMLYLHSRIKIEGWGIELGFKQIASRLSKRLFYSLVMGISLMTVLQLGIKPAMAAVPLDVVVAPKKDKEILKELVLHEAINPYQVQTTWEKKTSFIGNEDPLQEKKTANIYLPNMSYVAELVKFLLVGVALAIVLWGVYRYRTLWAFLNTNKERGLDTSSQVVFGLSISEASLPDNVGEVAQQFLEREEYASVLSLLYRASLAALVNKYQISIKSSDTEGDCLLMAEQVLSNNKFHYFQVLMTSWQKMVYAQRQPSLALMNKLVSDWEVAFGQLSGTISRVSNDA